MRKTSALYRYERQAVHRRTADVAKRLGVTATGLETLGRAVAHPTGRVLSGGTGRGKLLRQGYAEPDPDTLYQYRLTPAGREIVRQARELGW